MGRNLVYLLREGYDVFGADADPGRDRAKCARWPPAGAVAAAGELPRRAARALTFPERSATVVISSAVLHFARDDEQFEAMLAGSWRVLASGGMFFCRLASTIGIESRVRASRRQRPPPPASGRHRALSGGRSAADGPHAAARRTAARSAEDDGGPGSAVDDDVGGAEGLTPASRYGKALRRRTSTPPDRPMNTVSISSRKSPCSTMPGTRARCAARPTASSMGPNAVSQMTFP